MRNTLNNLNFDKYFFNNESEMSNKSLKLLEINDNFLNNNSNDNVKNFNSFLSINDKNNNYINYNNEIEYYTDLSNFNSNLKINSQFLPSFNDKIYIAKPFNASPSNVYNGLPWFLDYVHLSFWFFFISTVISVLFIIYFFTFVWNNQENKYPIRETRGFSRAQTGDTMTAIIPMTWSITMLLHASTHSNNFDENTTGTCFSLTVIAYQWGWNYYYPKDIIGIFSSTPKKVGHNNVDYFNLYDNFYETLLDISRNQILNKNLLLGIGSSKIGKNNIQTMQSLFFKPYGYNQNLQLPAVLFNSLNSKKNNSKIQAVTDDVKNYISQLDQSLLNYTYNSNDVLFLNFINTNTLNNLNFNFYSLNLYNRFNILNFYKNLNYNFFLKNIELNLFFYKIINFNEILNQSLSLNVNLNRNISNSVLKYKLLDSHRNKNTFFSNSNKVFLVYKHFIDEFKRPLSETGKLKFLEELTYRQLEIEKVRRLFNDNTLFYTNMSLEDFNFSILDFMDIFCLSINQWLLNNNYDFFLNSDTNQQFWVDLLNLNYNPIKFDFKFLFYNKNKNLNFNDNFQNIFFLFNNKFNIFNFKNVYQSFLFLSTDNSYLFYNNSILTFEDFGFNNSTSVKEFWYKNIMYSNYFIFNIINFFKFFNNYSFFNLDKFLFNNKSLTHNYKFWEIDSNILLAQNNIFTNNVLFDNNTLLSNNTFMFFWPSCISDLNKTLKNIFISYNSLLNILNYNYYSIRANYLLIQDLFIFDKKLLFVLYKDNKNKNDFNNTFFNFDNNYFIKNNSKLFLIKYMDNYNLFKLKLVNYILIKNFLLKNYSYNIIKNSSNFKNYKFTKLYSLSHNNVLLFDTLNNNYNFLFNVNFRSNMSIKNFSNYYLFSNTNLIKNSIILNNLNNFKELLTNNLNILFWDIFFKKNFNQTSVYLNKCVRVSLKFNDPLNFNFKLSSEISNIYYNNKYLFNWQLTWSDLTKNFNTALYKFYRGHLEKKFFSGYTDSKNINSPLYNDDCIFENYKITVFKNLSNPKKNFNYWSVFKKEFQNNNDLFSNVIDIEKFYFVKNYLTNLPNVNEDVDIDFILKYLNFDINTSRRNDHISKFKVYWGPLFTKYIKKLVLTNVKSEHMLNSLNIKNINFFKSYNLNLLKFDSFYLQNISLQKNYYLISLKIFSKYSNLKINFLKNNFFWNFNKFYLNSINEIKNINSLLCLNFDTCSFNWFFYKKNLVQYFILNSNFLNYWSSLWFFKDNLQNFSNKIFFNKNFKDNSDLLNKIFLISSFKDKELKNIFNNNYKLNNSLTNISDDLLLLRDFSAVLNLYQNNFDIKNNVIINLNINNLLLNDLNLFKSLDNNIFSQNNIINKFKSLYYNYYILQLQKSLKSRFDYKEINNNISNIRRLRVSKGICLPSDISIHIICASKDVIHSWAIPGLGVKIDAIPGFNSHRRALFRWRGLYWGQCMEVCGRYHHWMPILVRIIHKDLFLIWCLSYLRLLNNKNFKYEKYFFDEILLLDWLSDSNNSICLENFFKTILKKENPELRLILLETLLESDM